ncbi:unnamed protein product [Lasius platythorax]|uniref:Uncharacterized protein n=1 Tax=Lasius platythorax TaxID=488582 RepID=A0AAV2NJ88_9HYME
MRAVGQESKYYDRVGAEEAGCQRVSLWPSLVVTPCVRVNGARVLCPVIVVKSLYPKEHVWIQIAADDF